MFVSENTNFIGAVALSDTVKETSVQAVNRLSRMDIDVCMLTGDNDATAAAIAKSVGIKKVFANVLPHENQKKILSFKSKTMLWPWLAMELMMRLH